MNQRHARLLKGRLKDVLGNYQQQQRPQSKIESTLSGLRQSLTGKWHDLQSTERVTVFMKKYEDIIGLTDVKAAQARVIQAQDKFMEMQEARRKRQLELHSLQSKLRELHIQIDKTPRTDDRYLALVTEEHSIMRQERQVAKEFEMYEHGERDYFLALSNSVRDSHEKERAQAERTKYWSIIGSVTGAIIGILGTTISNWRRMKELRHLVVDAVNAPHDHGSSMMQDVAKKVNSNHEALESMQSQLENVLKSSSTHDDGKKLRLGTSGTSAVEELLEVASKQQEELQLLLGKVEYALEKNTFTGRLIFSISAIGLVYFFVSWFSSS